MAGLKEQVKTTNSPPPLPQFSQAVKCNGMVYCSGNVGRYPNEAKLAEGGIQPETRQALKNLSAVLEAAGSSLDNVVKVNIFLTTMDNFALMNEVYDEFFNMEIKPCRTCVAVYQLPVGALVEIECIAALNPASKL